MQLLSFLAVTGLVSSVAARSARSVGKKTDIPRPRYTIPAPAAKVEKRQAEQIITTEASKSVFIHAASNASVLI